MSAEKETENEDVFVFFQKAAAIEQQFDLLNTRYLWYCQEVTALERKLANGSKRQESRQARLGDLKTRLLPQLQAQLDKLQDQHGGSFY